MTYYRKEKDPSSYEPYPKRVKYTNEDSSVNLSASDHIGTEDMSEEGGSDQEQDLSNVMMAPENHKD